MQRIIIWLLAVLLIIGSFTNCHAQRRKKKKLAKTACQSTIAQGVAGMIEFSQGNFMPGPGVSGGSKKPVQRTVYVYTARKAQDGSQGGFHTIPKEKPLFMGQSCAYGRFTIGLPEGYYSLFVLEEGKLYANGTDGEGYLNPVKVEAGKLAQTDIQINYKAVY